jgi:hypothetical protein
MKFLSQEWEVFPWQAKWLSCNGVCAPPLLFSVGYYCDQPTLYVFSGFRRGVHEICALLGCYATSCGNPLPTFRDKVSVPSSTVNNSKKNRKPAPRYAVYIAEGVGSDCWLSSRLLTASHCPHLPLYKLRTEVLVFYSSWTAWPSKIGPIRCPETTVKDYQSTLRNITEESRSQPIG